MLKIERLLIGDVAAAQEIWQAGHDAIADAAAYLTETGLEDLEVGNVSVRALLALAGRVLDEHVPHEVCATTYCLGCQIDVWPCAAADHALRAVGALTRGTTTDEGTPA